MSKDKIIHQNKDEILLRLYIAKDKGKNFRVLFYKSNTANKTIRYMTASRIISFNFKDDYATVYDEKVEDIRRFKISNVVFVELNMENPPMNEKDIENFIPQNELMYTHIDIKV